MPFSGSQRFRLRPKERIQPPSFSFSTVDRNSGSLVQLSSQTWNCNRSIASVRSFFLIWSAYLMTWSGENTSWYLYFGNAGHLSLAGGIFEAAYSRFLLPTIVSPPSPPLFPL